MMSFVVYYIHMHYLYIQHYRGLSLARCQRKCYTDVCHTVVNIRNVGHSECQGVTVQSRPIEMSYVQNILRRSYTYYLIIT